MRKLLGLAMGFYVFSAHASSAADIYTLYRNSMTDKNMRVHVATFDAKYDAEVDKYLNKENCEIASGLFQNQIGVKVKYWCEKGIFKE